jgi:GNAT superfamily N-acetyltransferase
VNPGSGSGTGSGVQMLCNYFTILYSSFCRNDRKRCFPAFYEIIKLELAEKRSQVTSRVAELDGKVIGFIISDVSSWKYDVPENIGWIDIIGVDPAYQRKGIAKTLFTEMTNNLKKVVVDTIYTFVTRRDCLLLKFLDRMGLQKGDMINLELAI